MPVTVFWGTIGETDFLNALVEAQIRGLHVSRWVIDAPMDDILHFAWVLLESSPRGRMLGMWFLDVWNEAEPDDFVVVIFLLRPI